jgi:site-specific recombinase XerD
MQIQTKGCPDPVKEYSEWKQRPGIKPGLVEGLLAPHWDDFAATMFERGYRWSTVRRTIEIAKPFAAYAKGNGIGSATEFTDEVVDGYLKQRKLRESQNCLRLLMGFLAEHGVINPTVAPSEQPSPLLLEEYRHFLREHRGIGERTIKAHCSYVKLFLGTLGEHAEPATIQDLDATAVFRFIEARAAALTRSERKRLCAAVRCFLRFLVLRGYLLRDLVSSVPVIPNFRLAGLPKPLAREEIEKILSAVDRSTTVGRRDYAMFLILATYGIRGGQLCALQLEDVAWRRETLRVRAAKGGRDVIFPLLHPVADALVDYLRNGRPVVPFREIFLRVRPPLRPLGGSLGQVIKPYARRAGVTAPFVSPRAWRHGFATKMLAHGQPFKNISDMLGHRSIETTYIYTKVDIEMLRQAALDWPEEVR